MNDKNEPEKPQPTTAVSLEFLDIALTPVTPPPGPLTEVTLSAHACCIEALAYAVRAALAAGLVDPRQSGCLPGVFAQLIGKLPAPLVNLMGMAIERAVEEHKARTAKALYDAATASPSTS